MRPLFWALVVAVAAASAPAASHAQRPAPEAATEALRHLERALQSAEPERTALARRALDVLDAHPELTRSAWLRAPLAADPPDLTQARERLTAAVSALEGSGGVPVTPTASDALDRILAGPPFQAWSWLALVPAVLLPVVLLIRGVLERIWNAVRWPFDRILELVNRLLAGLFFTPAVLVLALLVSTALVWLYRRGLRAALVAQAEVPEDRGALPPTSAEALAQAQRHAARGEFRDACHFVFMSSLLWLEEQGRARFAPAATNREYLAQIAAQPAVAAAMEPVVARFDRLWYGQDVVDQRDYESLRAAVARLREAVA